MLLGGLWSNRGRVEFSPLQTCRGQFRPHVISFKYNTIEKTSTAPLLFFEIQAFIFVLKLHSPEICTAENCFHAREGHDVAFEFS